MKDLAELYTDYVMALEDSAEHKDYLLNSVKCYEEWCEEYESEQDKAYWAKYFGIKPGEKPPVLVGCNGNRERKDND